MLFWSGPPEHRCPTPVDRNGLNKQIKKPAKIIKKPATIKKPPIAPKIMKVKIMKAKITKATITQPTIAKFHTTTKATTSAMTTVFPHRMRTHRKISVGSDCSGWASEIHALRLLGLHQSIDHQFACDVSGPSKTIILQNWPPKHWFDDCLARKNDHHVPKVDIYVAGFPCQPYSAAGQNKGINDDRATVFHGVIDYIKCRLPNIVVLENVKNLISKTHKDMFASIIHHLKSIADYKVHWAIYDSQKFGIPQHRERLYIVAIRQSVLCKPPGAPKFHDIVMGCSVDTPSLRTFLGYPIEHPDVINKRLATDLDRFSKTGRRNLANALKEIRSSKLEPWKTDIVVDIGGGHQRTHMVHNICPTITRTRASHEDFYLVSAARRLPVRDLCKLQGLDIRQLNLAGISNTQLGQLAGNAMTIPVLAAILRAALLVTGMAVDV